MNISEAMEILRGDVSGYFCDDLTDFGIEHMREHYLSSKSHPKWNLIQSAFEIILEEDGTESQISEFVRHEFNRDISLLPEGSKGFLAYIYRSVFKEE